MRCLLVEPDYKSKYPNIALMKISTKLKDQGHIVEYFKGKKQPTLDGGYDEIYITSLFTYESEITISTIKHYQKTFPLARIEVGGIFASLMPEYIEKETGIKPFVGYSKELDSLKPDYSLIKTGTKWDNFSFVFTSRGCVNRCPYCAVPRIEKEFWINTDWRNQVDYSRLFISIQDNNLTAMPIEHFKSITRFLRKYKLGTIFESGLDCRLFTEKHLSALKGVRFINSGLRFAFDNMSQEGYIQNTLKLCLDSGISPTLLRVYVLFNFDDTPQEAEYRARELLKFDVDPYPQRYIPLTQLKRHPKHVGRYWTDELALAFRQFYQPQRATTFRKYTFPEWLEINCEKELLEQFNKHPYTI